MSTEPILQWPLVIFAEAFAPLAEDTKRRMQRPQSQTAEVPDMPDFISRHVTLLGQAAGSLTKEVDRALQGTSDADVHRAIGRMEVHLERLLTGYDEVRRADPDGADLKGWSLLRDLYRDVLLIVQRWLDDVVDIANDPISGLERRGFSTQDNVTITLDLDPSIPMLEELVRWMEDRADEVEAWADLMDAAETSRSSHSMFWSLAAAFGLGWWLGGDE